MKKLFSLLVGLLMFGAGAYAQDIQLNPGWNAVSTPAYLSDLTFSNGGEGISFTTLKDGSWISVPATVDNIKPLDGFMVYNANSSTVTLTLDYKTNPTPAESIWQKQLSRGWNLLGITTTDDPFKGVDATMFVDPTLGGRYTVSNGISNPELGEAYFVFVSDGSIYGGVNTTEVAVNDEPEVVEEEPITNVDFFATGVINYPSSRIVLSNDYISIAKFRIRSDGDGILNSFVLKSNSNENTKDKGNLMIYVGSDEIDLYHTKVNNDGDIVVSGLNYEIKSSWKTVEVIYLNYKGTGLIDYTLTKVNNNDANINIKKRIVDRIAYIKKQTNLGTSTLFKFGIEKSYHAGNITGVVLFAGSKALNDPIDLVENGLEIEIANKDQEQIIDAIGYGCPEGTTNINQCNFNMQKSEDAGWFSIGNNVDVKVFKL